MAAKIKVVQVGEREFEIAQLPTTKARRLRNKLLATLAPPMVQALGGIAGAAAKGGFNLASVLNADMSAFAPAISRLFEKLTPDQEEEFVRELLFNARVRSDTGVWVSLNATMMEEAFAGRLEDQDRLVIEAVKLNYENFIGSLIAAMSAAKPEAAEEPPK